MIEAGSERLPGPKCLSMTIGSQALGLVMVTPSGSFGLAERSGEKSPSTKTRVWHS